MVIREELTPEQIRHVLHAFEFGSDVTEAAPFVAVVMSQSWCPQWHYLNSGLSHLAATVGAPEPEIRIFTFVYDESEFFDEFLSLKEKTFGNYEIPYIRYYRNGTLFDQSNYLSIQGFLDRFRR